MREFFLVASMIIGLLVLLTFYRAISGPGLLNRILGVNVIGTKTVIILLLMGFIYGRVDMFVDISMVYAMLNFIATLAAAKYLERKVSI
ncbi:MAG: pH regulation protein F [Nitrospinae bacterium RIFCSPLOWO2_12_FULL_45_22]|nr:MAG: pH regulation protein F [Nitrospinae bacterium RIFCSPLOWO2_12_FULL_45_22]